MVAALERTFGFELEIASNANALALALREAGLSQSPRLHSWHCRCEYCDEYFGQRGNWFKVQRDSSCGGEAISSILRWGDRATLEGNNSNVNPAHLIDGLTRVLLEEDIPIDNRCGLHVHVGARDLSDAQLGRLYSLMHHYEAILYRLACGRAAIHRGYGNDFNYCRPMSGFDNPVELQELALLKTSQVKSSPIAYNKYIMANLMPIETLGTVEFRLWESTRSRRRLRMYSKLSVALVQRARQRRNPVGPALPLGAEADDEVFDQFTGDLYQGAPELVDDEFIEDLQWQWQRGPATWQPGVSLPPLPHRTPDGTWARTAEDEVVERYDSHSRTIHIPPQYDLERERRNQRLQERERQRWRREVIPAHLRDEQEGEPNYDCGNPGCRTDLCQRNRQLFWTGVYDQDQEENNTPAPRVETPWESVIQEAGLQLRRTNREQNAWTTIWIADDIDVQLPEEG